MNENNSEKIDLMEIIIGEINETNRPLDLVVKYIVWKNNGSIKEKKLTKEFKSFIDYLAPEIIESMLDKLVELKLIKRNKDGSYSRKEE